MFNSKYNNLNEKEKVNLILELNKNHSLNEISNILNIKKNTIKALMEKYNYSFNGKSFIKHKEATTSKNTSIKESVPSDRLYALEMRIFELETILRNVNSDLQNHKKDHISATSSTSNIETKSINTNSNIILKNSVEDKLKDFLKLHPNLNKNDVINDAIIDYLKYYNKLVIYNK